MNTAKLIDSSDSMLGLAIGQCDTLPRPTEADPYGAPLTLATMAQAAAATAQAKLELERSRNFISARGVLIAVEDIASVYIDYCDPEKGEGVLIIAKTPITRRDEVTGQEKTPTTKTYKFFGASGRRLRAWFNSHEFFNRFVAFDAGGDDFDPPTPLAA